MKIIGWQGALMHCKRDGAMMAGEEKVGVAAEPRNKMLQRCWGWDYRAPCIYMISARRKADDPV